MQDKGRKCYFQVENAIKVENAALKEKIVGNRHASELTWTYRDSWWLWTKPCFTYVLILDCYVYSHFNDYEKPGNLACWLSSIC